MTKKEMLLEMCNCSKCKADTKKVEGWYNFYKTLEVNKFKGVKSIKNWKSWVRYVLGGK